VSVKTRYFTHNFAKLIITGCGGPWHDFCLQLPGSVLLSSAIAVYNFTLSAHLSMTTAHVTTD